jgi:hypothetical protein
MAAGGDGATSAAREWSSDSAPRLDGRRGRRLQEYKRRLYPPGSILHMVPIPGTAGDAEVSSLGDAKSSLGDAESSLGDAESSLGDAKSSLGDAESSLGDAESSLGDA